ncbi:hypothetical protein GCM10010464_36690 [Pseudonocardia yunnanensis]|uniref:DUF222 domain-containing protein n=1 Tax=Pseudonocardia yunnanensis TaxID=58107 RepID=A0ABW4F934_9PSEU
MSDGAGSTSRISRRALVQQARRRAIESARDEGVRISDGVQHAATALSAIGDRARSRSGESARVRALGLECLPDSRYLAYRVAGLRAALDASRSRRSWLAGARGHADEVEALLARAIELTSTIDIAGELELPLDLVVAVQTGARAGLSALGRLHDDLDAVENGPHESSGNRAVTVQPSSPAHWLVQVASRLLPGASRDRYLEEFTGELRELADSEASSRAQLAHALRLAARVWSLRNALPGDAPRSATGPDRVRVHPGSRPDGINAGRARARRWDVSPTPFGRWKAKRDARLIVRIVNKREQARERASRRRSPAHAHGRRLTRVSRIENDQRDASG